jgi:hypothetical protein
MSVELSSRKEPVDCNQSPQVVARQNGDLSLYSN